MSAIELRYGDWRSVLQDVECDALICDPPYSAETHAGDARGQDRQNDGSDRNLISYEPWTPQDVIDFVSHWSPRTRGWMACFTDDVLSQVWKQAYRDCGRYAFPSVPILQHKPRRCGDGPGSGAVYLMVARPKRAEFMDWGSLPGWYMSHPERGSVVSGAKPISLMRTIVRDYSRPNDLVCDPTCGGATALLAAATEGRRAIGAERTLETFEYAMKRIQAGYTPPLFVDDERAPAEQSNLLFERE